MTIRSHPYGPVKEYTNHNRCVGDEMTSGDSPLKAAVREKYGRAALRVAESISVANCSGSSGCAATVVARHPITSDLYDQMEKADVPAEALLASLGCGNPTALAELKEGETVLDLGSGGGIDVLLSARRVGRTGRVYGLDMSDEMLALANENKRKVGAENVEFLKGEIEQIPLPDASVDVIISNCVINLSGDKKKVLKEAFRVLRPAGRLAVSDVVVRGDVAESARTIMEQWIGCIAGALEEQQYLKLLSDAGFANPSVEPTRVYKAQDGAAFLSRGDLNSAELSAQVDGKFVSAFVRATKPADGRAH